MGYKMEVQAVWWSDTMSWWPTSIWCHFEEFLLMPSSSWPRTRCLVLVEMPGAGRIGLADFQSGSRATMDLWNVLCMVDGSTPLLVGRPLLKALEVQMNYTTSQFSVLGSPWKDVTIGDKGEHLLRLDDGIGGRDVTNDPVDFDYVTDDSLNVMANLDDISAYITLEEYLATTLRAPPERALLSHEAGEEETPVEPSPQPQTRSMMTRTQSGRRSPVSWSRHCTCTLRILENVGTNWWSKRWRHTTNVKRSSGKCILARQVLPRWWASMAGRFALSTPWMAGTSRTRAIAGDSLSYKMKNVLMWFGGHLLAQYGVLFRISTRWLKRRRLHWMLNEIMRSTSTWSLWRREWRNKCRKVDMEQSRTQHIPRPGRHTQASSCLEFRATWISVCTERYFRTMRASWPPSRSRRDCRSAVNK